ncbi:MAG: HEAT repeat domain-containing protein [Planctomycetes bacterium]|nr:HEAT repeat domain-containing protein [Planctomycetota bacterium]
MKRLIFVLSLALAATPLFAGKFEKDVKDLGDSNLRSGAIDKLFEAGTEAFDDLMDGLKADPNAAGVTDIERAAITTRRYACVQLLGALRDTRAAKELVRLLKDDKTRQEHHQLSATLAQSLALIWAGKAASAERTEAIDEIKLRAKAADSGDKLRYGCLNALATLKEGADIALPFLAEDKDELLRNAAIAVLAATQHKAAAPQLVEIWTKQRAGEAKNYNRALGLSALFAVASFKDKAALDGLLDVLTMTEFDRDEANRSRARVFLKEFSADAIPKLAGFIKDDSKAVQHARSAELLGVLGGAGVRALLDIAKEDKEGERKFTDRVEAMLRSLRGDDANKAMIEAFRTMDAKDKGRVKILEQLLLQRPKDALPVFKEAANDKDLEATVRSRALEGYADIEGSNALEALKAWGKDADVNIRRAAIRSLGKSYIPQPKSEPVLVEALADVDPEVRSTALRGLQLSKKKEMLQKFLSMFDAAVEPDPAVRKTAIEALETLNRSASLNDQGLLEPLRAAVGAKDKKGDVDPNVRAAALRVGINVALRVDNPGIAREMLEKCLEDESPVVRSQAYTMVYLVKDVDVKKLIAQALKETEPQQMGDAVQGISNVDLGDADLTGLPELSIKVLQQPSITNAEFAKNAINKLVEKGKLKDIAPKVRELLDAAGNAAQKDFRRMATYVNVLSDIKDKESQTFELVRKLAKADNFDIRQAGVKFIQANGDRGDVAFLRELRDLGDNTAPAVRQDIENAIRELESR